MVLHWYYILLFSLIWVLHQEPKRPENPKNPQGFTNNKTTTVAVVIPAKDRFEQKGIGFFLRHTGCIPIDRRNPDTSWIHESMIMLHEEKESVAIFPEGAHGTHRNQLPFLSGVVMLAALADVPVVMVYIDGPHKILRKRAKLIIAPPFRLDPPIYGLDSDYIARQKIIENSDRLPHPIRMEANVVWLHIDVLEQYGIDEKVHLFNP